jgi:hypothetical protein
MNTILSWLSNIKVTLTQVALGAVAVVVAGLAIALEVTLGKLHSTQTKLLEATYGNQVSDADKAVAVSRQKFLEALKAYRGNK